MGRAATAALRACLALTVLGAGSDADALPTEGAARRLQPSLLNASSEAALSGCAWEQFDDLLKAAGTACCGATDCLDKGATLGLNQSCSVACAKSYSPLFYLPCTSIVDVLYAGRPSRRAFFATLHDNCSAAANASGIDIAAIRAAAAAAAAAGPVIGRDPREELSAQEIHDQKFAKIAPFVTVVLLILVFCLVCTNVRECCCKEKASTVHPSQKPWSPVADPPPPPTTVSLASMLTMASTLRGRATGAKAVLQNKVRAAAAARALSGGGGGGAGAGSASSVLGMFGKSNKGAEPELGADAQEGGKPRMAQMGRGARDGAVVVAGHIKQGASRAGKTTLKAVETASVATSRLVRSAARKLSRTADRPHVDAAAAASAAFAAEQGEPPAAGPPANPDGASPRLPREASQGRGRELSALGEGGLGEEASEASHGGGPDVHEEHFPVHEGHGHEHHHDEDDETYQYP